MKKSFVQVLSAICLLGLGASTVFYKSKFESVEKDLSFCQDTIRGLLKAKYLPIAAGYEEIMGKRELALGDSLIERHRIGWCISEAMIVILEVKLDSSVRLIYRRAEVHNELLGGKSGLKLLREEVKMIPRGVLQEFHKKLAAVSFLDAVKNVDYMCCFSVGSIDWEAAYKNGERLKHGTWCRQSVQFASACEYLFQFVDDPVLKTHLKGL